LKHFFHYKSVTCVLDVFETGICLVQRQKRLQIHIIQNIKKECFEMKKLIISSLLVGTGFLAACGGGEEDPAEDQQVEDPATEEDSGTTEDGTTDDSTTEDGSTDDSTTGEEDSTDDGMSDDTEEDSSTGEDTEEDSDSDM
jgi:hypothetical protein